MAAANGESARGELTRVESSKVASAIRDYRSKLHRLAGVLPSSGGHRGGLFLARHILPRSCRVDVIPLRHSWCSGDAMADHFVTAELARLSSVADARDAAAAAAAESEQHPYLVEVARRARAAHDLAAALAASPPSAPPAARSIPRVHCSELSLARFRREFCVPALPVVITGLGPHLTEDGERGAELGWLRRHGATKKVAVTRDNAHVNSTSRARTRTS